MVEGIPNQEERNEGGNTLGKYTYGTPSYGFCGGRGACCHIGRYTSVAVGVTILCGGEHHTNQITTYPFYNLMPNTPNYHEPLRTNKVTGKKGEVHIGSDVWLGRNCLILNGVTIGDGCVIGAGTVIARDCEPFGVYVGNPAVLVRYRFDEPTRERLLKLAWWDMDVEVLQPYINLLQSNNITEFLDIMEKL